MERRCGRATTTIRSARQQLLDAAGYKPDGKGVRFHLAMKTSNDEGTRLLAAVLQQQLAKVGIALDLRSYEFATFYSDVTQGAFQMYSLRWIGGNEQPDIFGYAFQTANFSPKGANRGHYSNAKLDALLEDAATNEDTAKRRADYVEAQQILARDLPAFNLWYLDTIVVHNRRLIDVVPAPSGSYRFLRRRNWRSRQALPAGAKIMGQRLQRRMRGDKGACKDRILLRFAILTN